MAQRALTATAATTRCSSMRREARRRTRRRARGHFASPTLRYAGPTGLALDSIGNFYVNGALHSTLGSTVRTLRRPGLAMTTIPRLIRRARFRGTATTKPSSFPGSQRTSRSIAAARSSSANVSMLSTGSSYPPCQGRVNVFAAGATGGTTDVHPLRVLTLGTALTTNSSCALAIAIRSSRSFPSLTLYGSSLFVADDFNNAIDAFSSSGNRTVQADPADRGLVDRIERADRTRRHVTVSGQAKAGSGIPGHSIHHK